MDRDALRAYLDRDRAAVEASKRSHHAGRYRAIGAAAGIEAGITLRDWARRVRPDWPTDRDRAEDLAHHLALKALIDRYADAFASR